MPLNLNYKCSKFILMKNRITNVQPSSVSKGIVKPHVVRRFKCWLGFHDWVNIDTNPMPNPKAGEMICWSDLHECEHCKKQEYKGMGCVV